MLDHSYNQHRKAEAELSWVLAQFELQSDILSQKQ